MKQLAPPQGKSAVNVMQEYVRPMVADVTHLVEECEKLMRANGWNKPDLRDQLTQELSTLVEDLREAFCTPFNRTATRAIIVAMIDAFPQSARWSDSKGYEHALLMLLENPPRTLRRFTDQDGLREIVEPEMGYQPFSPHIIAVSVLNLIASSKFVPTAAEVLDECRSQTDRLIYVGQSATAKIQNRSPPRRPGSLKFVKTA